MLVQREDIRQLYFDFANRPSTKEEEVDETDQPGARQQEASSPEEPQVKDTAPVRRKRKTSTLTRWKNRLSGQNFVPDVNSEVLNHLDEVMLMSSGGVVESMQGRLSIGMFEEFLRTQKNASAQAQCAATIARRYSILSYNEKGEDFPEDSSVVLESVSLMAFGWYLLCEARMGLLHTKFDSACSSLNQPLSQYYIASSHNTYLTAHQLFGLSAVDMYIQVNQPVV